MLGRPSALATPAEPCAVDAAAVARIRNIKAAGKFDLQIVIGDSSWDAPAE